MPFEEAFEELCVELIGLHLSLYLSLGHRNAVVPHVQLLVHLYGFINSILQKKQTPSDSSFYTFHIK